VFHRTTFYRIGISLPIAIGLVSSAITAWSQQRPAANPNMETRDKYQGSATVLKSGKPVPVRAAIRQIIVQGHQHVAELPARGFLLLQLRGGKITAVINGKEEKHVAGDFWVVPANAKMSFDATGETATIEVVSLDVP
jgi:quercetin dioxygenase-like cupin family protein